MQRTTANKPMLPGHGNVDGLLDIVVFGVVKNEGLPWKVHPDLKICEQMEHVKKYMPSERQQDRYVYMSKGHMVNNKGLNYSPADLGMRNGDYLLAVAAILLGKEFLCPSGRVLMLLMVNKERMFNVGTSKMQANLDMKSLKQRLMKHKDINLEDNVTVVHNGIILEEDDTLKGAGVGEDNRLAFVDVNRGESDRHLERLIILNAFEDEPLFGSVLGEPEGFRLIHNLNNIRKYDGHENQLAANICKNLLDLIKNGLLPKIYEILSKNEIANDAREAFKKSMECKMSPGYAHASDFMSDIHEGLIVLRSRYQMVELVWNKLFEEVLYFFMKLDPLFKTSCGRDYEPFKSDAFANLVFDKFPVFSDLPEIHESHSRETTLFFGPKRDGKTRPNLPIVKLRGLTNKTTIQDVINSYKFYAKLKECEISSISFNNQSASPKDLVRDVLRGLFHRNYMMFEDNNLKDLRDLDNVLDFIEGKKDVIVQKKKKKGKNLKNSKVSGTTNSVELEFKNTEEIPEEKLLFSKLVRNIKPSCANQEDKIPNLDQDGNSGNGAGLKNDSIKVMNRDANDNKECCPAKLKLQDTLKNKTILLNEHKSNVEEMIETKSKEMKNLLIQIGTMEEQNCQEGKQMDSLDADIVDLEKKLANLKEEKKKRKSESDNRSKTLNKLNTKKVNLERNIEAEMNQSKKQEQELTLDIMGVTEQIADLDLDKKVENKTALEDPKHRLVAFLTSSIKDKENDLECPVCLETASVPIYSCPESHLICSSCRPRIAECPVCRTNYGDKEGMKRHRYAEKTAKELEKLKEEILKNM